MGPRIVPVITMHCQKVGIFAKEKEEGDATGRSRSGIDGINIRIYLSMPHTHAARNPGLLPGVSRSLYVYFSPSSDPRATA